MFALWWYAQLPQTGAVGEEYLAAWRDLNPAPPLSELVQQRRADLALSDKAVEVQS